MSTTNRQLASGVMYTAIAKYSGIVISLVVTGILSRLLPTEDFGTVAIATVIIAFFSIFSDLGIAPAIIQKQDLDKKDLSNIFSFTLWSGIVLSLLFFFSSSYVSHFYNNQALTIICQLLSINLFFATLNIVPNALLIKAKRFRFIAFRTLIVQIICGSISVFAAFGGWGIYALLINPICSSVILFVINFKQYPQIPRLTLGTTSIKKIFSFSAYQFLFNVINYFSRNLDNLLIGKFMGMSPLAYYEKSYRLMMLPLQNITHIISPVMHPIFAEHQNDLPFIAKSYEKIVRLLAFIGFPLAAILFFCSKELIVIIFGNQWLPSVPIFQILSLSVGIQIILSTSGSIFQAANSTKTLFISGLLSTVLNVIAICLGLFVFKTLEAVAICIVISFTLNFIQCYILMYYVTFRLSAMNFIKQLISPLILGAIIFTSQYLLSTLIEDINYFVSLIIKGALFLFTFTAYIQLTGEYNIIKRIKR